MAQIRQIFSRTVAKETSKLKEWKHNRIAFINGLKRCSELNGRMVIVRKYIEEKDKWVVTKFEMESEIIGKSYLINGSNLKKCQLVLEMEMNNYSYKVIKRATVYQYYIVNDYCMHCGKRGKKRKNRKIRACRDCVENARKGVAYYKKGMRMEVGTYCSKYCQKRDWKTHREGCRSFANYVNYYLNNV